MLMIGMTGCATRPSIIIPLANGRACEKVPYSDICDADIKAGFPDIRLTDKALDTDSDDAGYTAVTLMIRYTPDVQGPHVALRKELRCTQYDRGQPFHCALFRGPVYFDADPNDYLAAESGIPPVQAELIVHLWMQGKVVADDPDWIRVLTVRLEDVRWSALMRGALGGYMLLMHSSGCNGPVHVKIEGEGEQQVLRVTQPPEVMCV